MESDPDSFLAIVRQSILIDVMGMGNILSRRKKAPMGARMADDGYLPNGALSSSV